jgi:hypothetical protein
VGPKSRFGHGGEEKNFQPLLGIESLISDRPARSQLLYRLSYPGSQDITCACNEKVENRVFQLMMAQNSYGELSVQNY